MRPPAGAPWRSSLPCRASRAPSSPSRSSPASVAHRPVPARLASGRLETTAPRLPPRRTAAALRKKSAVAFECRAARQSLRASPGQVLLDGLHTVRCAQLAWHVDGHNVELHRVRAASALNRTLLHN